MPVDDDGRNVVDVLLGHELRKPAGIGIEEGQSLLRAYDEIWAVSDDVAYDVRRQTVWVAGLILPVLLLKRGEVDACQSAEVGAYPQRVSGGVEID